VGKTLEDINLSGIFNSNVVQLQRGSTDIQPSAKTKIRYGDRLCIATDISHAEAVAEFLGNNIKQVTETDFLPITLGIIIGIFIGSLTIPIHDTFQIKLGLGGGVLISSLVLSYIGKTGPIVWSMSNVSNNLFRQLGLLMFLAAVGTDAGTKLGDVLNIHSITIVAIGCIVAVGPMIIGYMVGKHIMKISFIPLMGILVGALTSTLGLTIIGVKTKSENLQANYATAYPFALVLMIILPQILTILTK
jgi:putative transport protein